jgi:hypothetical protein
MTLHLGRRIAVSDDQFQMGVGSRIGFTLEAPQPRENWSENGKFKRVSNVYLRMEIEPTIPSNEPRLGLFWFIAEHRRPSRSASLSRAFSQVTEVAGFKTLDEGHVDVWPTVQRLDQTLLDYDYDHFPRGRVNWRKSDDRWLLVLDPKLNRAPFIAHIVFGWKIPRSRLLTLTDIHYRSFARVGPPQ